MKRKEQDQVRISGIKRAAGRCDAVERDLKLTWERNAGTQCRNALAGVCPALHRYGRPPSEGPAYMQPWKWMCNVSMEWACRDDKNIVQPESQQEWYRDRQACRLLNKEMAGFFCIENQISSKRNEREQVKGVLSSESRGWVQRGVRNL